MSSVEQCVIDKYGKSIATNSITGADLGFCDTNRDTDDTVSYMTCRPLQDKVSCQNVNSCSWTDTPIDCKQGGNVSALVATHPKRCCTDGGPKDCYDSHTYLVFQVNHLDIGSACNSGVADSTDCANAVEAAVRKCANDPGLDVEVVKAQDFTPVKIAQAAADQSVLVALTQ